MTTLRHSPLRVLLPSLAAVALAAPAAAGELAPVTLEASNPGALQMFAYVPTALPSGAPLVVVLHGCTQSAADYASQSGWLELADRHQFAVLAPEQRSSNNASRCFNWFQPGDATRDQGELLSIRQMVAQLVTTSQLDPSRVYVTGLSAGGYLTAAALAAYPEVFAAGASIAGGPFDCARNLSAALACSAGNVDRSPQSWADAVRGASSHQGPWPRLSIWHSSTDTTVHPNNARELVEQWTALHGLSPSGGTTDSIAGHTRVRYGAGEPAVESITLSGLGHGVPVDPGVGTDQCGTVGTYAIDAGVCSSLEALRFWGFFQAMPPTPVDAGPGPTTDAGASPAADAGADGSDAGQPGEAGGCRIGGAEQPLVMTLLLLLALLLRRRHRRPVA